MARPITAVCSTTWMFWSAVTCSISVSAIAAPVAAAAGVEDPPPAVAALASQRVCAAQDGVEPTPSDCEVRDPARPVLDQRPHGRRVAQAAADADVSSRCCSGESSGPIAAATPPWAKNEFEARSEPLVTSITRAPRWLAQTAA